MAAANIVSVTSSDYDDTGASESVSITWQTGDRILVLGATEDNSGTLSLPTVAGLTFTAMTGSPTNTASSSKGYAWQATAAGNGSGSVVSSRGGPISRAGITVYVLRGCSGLGTPVINVGTGKTVSVVRGGVNSLVAEILVDWSADVDVTIDPLPAGGTQRVAELGAGNYTTFVYDWPDQGATGTTSYGITNSASTGTFTKIAVEILGVGGTDQTVTTPAAAGTGDIPAPAASAGSSATAPAAAATGAVAAPAASAGATVAAPAADATGAVPAPTSSATGDGDVVAPPADGSGDVPAPSISADAAVSAPPGSAAGDAPDPSIAASATVTTPAADGTGDVPAPSISAEAAVSAPPADGTGQIPVADIPISATVQTGPASATGDLPDPTASGTGAATVSTPAVDGTGDTPAPAVSAGATPAPGPADATGDVPAPTAHAGATVTAPSSDATGGVPAPAASGALAGVPSIALGTVRTATFTTTDHTALTFDLPERTAALATTGATTGRFEQSVRSATIEQSDRSPALI